MKKGEGWALDTGQVEEEIQNKYFACKGQITECLRLIIKIFCPSLTSICYNLVEVTARRLKQWQQEKLNE